MDNIDEVTSKLCMGKQVNNESSTLESSEQLCNNCILLFLKKKWSQNFWGYYERTLNYPLHFTTRLIL